MDDHGDPVLDALRTALAGNDHPDLRIAVARHLIGAGRPQEALTHAREALAARPADIDVLTVAAASAEQSGDSEAAAGYRQVLSALTGQVPPTEVSSSQPSESSPPPPPSLPIDDVPIDDGSSTPASDPVRIDEPDEDDYDAFLREVVAEDQAGRIKLSDVGGMTKVKAELERRFFLPIRNPEVQKAYGKPLNGGLLLYGPPGCGKTFLARAVAGELDANFVPVTLHDTLDMWMGQSERNLHAVFRMARSKTPTVVFLDEVDALGQRRSRSASTSMKAVVAQLLNELDGAVDRNDGVFIIGATNSPWDVDPALRRPGRFDRTVLVLPPDEEARASILAYHLKDRPTADLNLGRLAGHTSGLTGADLMLICDTAVEIAMERAVRTGKVEPIDQKTLEKAAKSVKPSIGPWMDTARNFVTFTEHDGEYDDLEAFLRSRKK